MNDFFNNNNDEQKKDSEGGNLNYIFDGDRQYDSSNNQYAKEDDPIGFKKSDNIYESKASALYPQSKGYKNFIKIFISVTLAVMFFVAGYLTAYEFVPSQEEKFVRWLKNTIDKNYLDVEGGGVEFINGIGNGVIGSLDQYCGFYYGDSMVKRENENKGEYTDIGFHLNSKDDFLYVLKVYRGSLAFEKGIRAGDILIRAKASSEEEYTEFNGMSVSEISAAVTNILNKHGEIDMVFQRRYENGEGQQQEEPQEITAANLKPQKYSRIYSYYYDNDDAELEGINLDEDTAYITLEGFSYGADTQFAQNMQRFKQENKRNLILDLRTNFGGDLLILQNIASHLITDEGGSESVLLMNVQLKNISAKIPQYTTANYYNDYNFNKIVILADENSASATEVLISAMKDYGTLTAQIGNTTYGKAVMQRLFKYDDTCAISITIGKIYYPKNSDVSYNGIGLIPDYQIDFNFAGKYKYDERLLKAVEVINEVQSV